MAQIVVAPAGYTGPADYYCDGTDDQTLINAAIQYVASAYGGGTVHLLDGTFNLSGIVLPSSVRVDIIIDVANISLTGSGKGTILSSSTAGRVILISSVDAIVSDLNIESSGANATGVSVEGTGDSRATVERCYFSMDSTAFGIDFVAGIRNSATGNIVTSGSVGIADDTGRSNITGNRVSGCASGIVATNNYGTISDNMVYDNSNKGIDIASGASNSVIANYCYNNGSDTGIANTNKNNFSDAGTDTQVYSNSWQNPNAGEPNQGELHWLPQATATISGFLLNGVTTSAVWASLSFSGILPVGSKTARITAGVRASSSAAGNVTHAIAFSSDTTSTPAFGTHHPSLGLYYLAAGAGEFARNDFAIDIPLDSNLKSYYYAYNRTNASGCLLYLGTNGYKS